MPLSGSVGDDLGESGDVWGQAAREELAGPYEVAGMIQQLTDIARRINTQEFYWQEAHYDHDSRQGRELLFLIANHEWIRATSEIVDVSRSDSVETAIKIDIDLDMITHEAFRRRSGRFWLPVTVLPPQADATSRRTRLRHLEPDPFATVTDAAGTLMPILPAADLRHQLAAAMAEIIVNMAVANWPGPATETPAATRDERLLLSAALYRMLRPGSGRLVGGLRRWPDSGHPGPGDTDPAGLAARPAPARLDRDEPAPRIVRAKEQLAAILEAYIELFRPHPSPPRTAPGTAPADERETPQFAPEVATRAVKMLQALAESVIVVVPLEYDAPPTVLTVRVPTRSLVSGFNWSLAHPSTWVIRPQGHLEIDVLLPTADADRQIQVNLPDGVSFEEPGSRQSGQGSLPQLGIWVRSPQPLQELSAAMEQIFGSRLHQWPLPLVQSFIDLARVKAADSLDAMRHYEVGSGGGELPVTADDHTATDRALATLHRLAAELNRPAEHDGAGLVHLQRIWEDFTDDATVLFRRASADRLSARTVVARANLIEDAVQRAIPQRAKLHVDVTVDDRDYFSIARSSTGMSLILMLVVLSFLIGWRVVNRSVSPAPEVMAIVLTLFAAIQAGRIELPDRSTLHGQLSAIGNWLIAVSTFPALILAVALAFRPNGWVAANWTLGCIGLQLVLLVFMWRGPLTPGGTPSVGQRRSFTTMSPNYTHFDALSSDYWRSTTADALMIGRMAYGYVIWQKADSGSGAESASPNLRPLLSWQRNPLIADESTSVLAFLRAGTLRQAITFVVFRGKPADDWSADADVRAELDLDPGRLAPMESVSTSVDVFVGVDRDRLLAIGQHPLAAILRAASNKLIVLEAQLPVPPPVEGYGERQWARMRVALRDHEDIRHLTAFLNAMYAYTTDTKARSDYVIAVQTVPLGRPHVVTQPRTWAGAESDPFVLTSDLDVFNIAAIDEEGRDACTWRLLTICADARSGIESDIIDRLAAVRPRYQLAGLTYALLHGTALVVALVHETPPGVGTAAEPAGSDRREHELGLEADLRLDPALTKLRVLVDKELCRDQLGPVTQYPLLRVRYRWQDRPGAFLNVLNSISRILSEELRSLRPDDWSVSYARVQVVTGRIALGRLTIRLHAAAAEVAHWNVRKVEEIARKVATLAVLEAAAGLPSGSQADGLERPEDPVISIDLIRRPRPVMPMWAERIDVPPARASAEVLSGELGLPVPAEAPETVAGDT